MCPRKWTSLIEGCPGLKTSVLFQAFNSKPVWPSGKEAGKQKGLGVIPLLLSFLFKKVVVCGHCLVTLSLIINETLKWISSLPILIQESFWWWKCSDRYIISLPLTPPPYPLSPSIISLMVSVDVKHHVYLLQSLRPVLKARGPAATPILQRNTKPSHVMLLLKLPKPYPTKATHISCSQRLNK